MQGRRFLVTGGSQGIGAAIVKLTRRVGHEVVFTGRNERLIEQVTQETGAHGLRADVSAGADNGAKGEDVAVGRVGENHVDLDPRRCDLLKAVVHAPASSIAFLSHGTGVREALASRSLH